MPRPGRVEPTVRDRVVGGRPAHRDVRLEGFARDLGQFGEVRPDCLDVAAHDGTGQRRVAVAERVLQRGGEQRPQRRGGILGPGPRSSSIACVTSVTM